MCIFTETRYACGAVDFKWVSPCSQFGQCLIPHVLWTHYSLHRCNMCINGVLQPQLRYNISGLPSIPHAAITSTSSYGRAGGVARSSGTARQEARAASEETRVESDDQETDEDFVDAPQCPDPRVDRSLSPEEERELVFRRQEMSGARAEQREVGDFGE